jgi:hypothetical protein
MFVIAFPVLILLGYLLIFIDVNLYLQISEMIDWFAYRWLVPLILLYLVGPFLWFFIVDMRRQILARRSCRAYAGGHLIIPDQVFEEFVRSYYREKPAAEPVQALGRPRHCAYEWYKERGFDREALGLSMKELQEAMPKDDDGNPPSATTIRSWERQKPPTEIQ